MLAELLPAGVFAFFLVFARIGAAMMLLPGFGELWVPPRLRLVAALALSAVMTPVVAATLPAMPEAPADLIVLLGGETLIGAFLGTVARLVLAALQTGGMIIAYQSSLSNAFIFDPAATQPGALAGAYLSMAGLVLIFAADLHHPLLEGLANSYSTIRPGGILPVGDMTVTVVETVGRSFMLATQIAAPFIVVGLVFSVGAGLLARLMPQVQIFFIAVPLQIAIGLGLLAVTIGAILRVFVGEFESASMMMIGGN